MLIAAGKVLLAALRRADLCGLNGREDPTAGRNGTLSQRDFIWVSPDESASEPFVGTLEAAESLSSTYDLCITGEALAYIEQSRWDHIFIPRTQVGGPVCNPHESKQRPLLLAPGSTVRRAFWLVQAIPCAREPA